MSTLQRKKQRKKDQDFSKTTLPLNKNQWEKQRKKDTWSYEPKRRCNWENWEIIFFKNNMSFSLLSP